MEKPKYLVLNPVSIAFEVPPEEYKVELYYNQCKENLEYKRVRGYGKIIWQEEAIKTKWKEPLSYYYYDINREKQYVKVLNEL